MNEQISKIAKS